ncbi:xanthine dehydrogenase family protein subunit M [Cloacibacillus porcorum]|uniref:FAD binding domain-containing protein n=1 Tax=Cloacibacillus porcorum TaxID=1197717 RepID=UPI0023F3C734|nr:FAD binding domain-containing protein [Cloacibacillus porcorum]MDD7649192.1 FAD binding domain-containing protein [Cloacibacillus porcorum]MDY4093840.1 FAD binding domain-containing protein [Cloacibacillus porcorum]
MEKHLFPKNIKEALSLLEEYKGEARLVSGATDLMLWIREEKVTPLVLVDVSDIPEMRFVSVENGKMTLGAAMTHAEIAANEAVKRIFPALSDGCRSVGSPQIRNIATLAGNIVSAQPAADSVVPMTALGAVCEIVSSDGAHMRPLCELSKTVGESYVDPTKEILTKIEISVPAGKYGTAFKRIAPREAMALPVVNVAVMLEAAEDGTISAARVVASPVAVVPFRAQMAEAHLIGKKPSAELFAEAAKIAEDEASPRDSLVRGSGAYRKVLVKDLVEQALTEAAAAFA